MSLRHLKERLSNGEGAALLLWAVAAALVLWDGADGHLSETGRVGYLTGLLAVIVAILACAARNRRMHAHAARLGYEAGRQHQQV